MKKILSVCIPTYNMENLLSHCLDSFIVEVEYMNKLEVIIVNDGSRDNSLLVAQKYVEKYPNTYIVIDKTNGNYGSCVNAALNIATGKYFRLVDADDWVNTNKISDLINQLSNYDEHVIFTKFTKQYVLENKTEVCSDEGIRYNYVYDLKKEFIPISCLAMHAVTIKTDFLKNIRYKQTEGISYTDSEFVFYPLSQADKLRCLNINIYQYYIGRNEQTMSSVSLVKNYDNFEILYNKFLCFVPQNPNFNFVHLKKVYLYRMISYMLDVHIVYGGYTSNRDINLRTYIEDLSNTNKEVFSWLLQKKQNNLPYVKIWLYNKILGKLMIKVIKCLRYIK